MDMNVRIKLNSVTIQRDKFSNQVSGAEIWYTAIFAKGDEAEGHTVIKQEDYVGAIMEFTMVDILEIVAKKLAGR